VSSQVAHVGPPVTSRPFLLLLRSCRPAGAHSSRQRTFGDALTVAGPKGSRDRPHPPRLWIRQARAVRRSSATQERNYPRADRWVAGANDCPAQDRGALAWSVRNRGTKKTACS